MSASGLWQVDVQKRLGSEHWTNVYHLNYPSFGEAKSAADQIVTVEKGFHGGEVNFVSYRLAPFPAFGTQGTIINLTGTGQQGISPYVPLFNTLNAVFTPSQGRVSRKYYRLPVFENTQENGTFSSTFIQAYAPYLVDMLAITGLCDVFGRSFIGASFVSAVGMRQLRRGSKRRLGPRNLVVALRTCSRGGPAAAI